MASRLSSALYELSAREVAQQWRLSPCKQSVTTRAKARSLKRGEARRTLRGDDIVWTAWQHAAVAQSDGHVLAKHGEHLGYYNRSIAPCGSQLRKNERSANPIQRERGGQNGPPGLVGRAD